MGPVDTNVATIQESIDILRSTREHEIQHLGTNWDLVVAIDIAIPELERAIEAAELAGLIVQRMEDDGVDFDAGGKFLVSYDDLNEEQALAEFDAFEGVYDDV